MFEDSDSIKELPTAYPQTNYAKYAKIREFSLDVKYAGMV